MVAEKDNPKTAVSPPVSLGLPIRQVEYTRLHFGLSAAPGQFQAVTDRLVRPAKVKTPDNDLGDAAVVYLDDVRIAANEFQVLLQRTTIWYNYHQWGRLV